MINWRQIFKVLGMLLFIEAGLLLITTIVALIYKEDVMPFVWTLVITVVLGIMGRGIGWGAGRNMGRRDGYLIVSLVWLIFSLIGMIPFILAKSVPDVASAFFEAMSGFTSTGSTIMDNIDAQPKGILFWRSVTQWIGGMIRNGRGELVSGQTQLQAGDRVVVFCGSLALKKIEKFFS